MAHGDALTEKMKVLHNEAERCREIVRNLLSFARSHEHAMSKIAAAKNVPVTILLVIEVLAKAHTVDAT